MKNIMTASNAGCPALTQAKYQQFEQPQLMHHFTANISTVPNANEISVLLLKQESQITFRVINWKRDITLEELIQIVLASFVCKNYMWLFPLYSSLYTNDSLINYFGLKISPKSYMLQNLFLIQYYWKVRFLRSDFKNWIKWRLNEWFSDFESFSDKIINSALFYSLSLTHVIPSAISDAVTKPSSDAVPWSWTFQPLEWWTTEMSIHYKLLSLWYSVIAAQNRIRHHNLVAQKSLFVTS